jgi:hypothetical protein
VIAENPGLANKRQMFSNPSQCKTDFRVGKPAVLKDKEGVALRL